MIYQLKYHYNKGPNKDCIGCLNRVEACFWISEIEVISERSVERAEIRRQEMKHQTNSYRYEKKNHSKTKHAFRESNNADVKFKLSISLMNTAIRHSNLQLTDNHRECSELGTAKDARRIKYCTSQYTESSQIAERTATSLYTHYHYVIRSIAH